MKKCGDLIDQKLKFVVFAWQLCLFWHNLSCLMVSLLQWLVNMKLCTQDLYCNIGRTQSPTPLSSTSCQIQSWIPPQEEEGGIAILNPFKWASTVFERRFWHNTPNVYPMDHNCLSDFIVFVEVMEIQTSLQLEVIRNLG